MAGNTFGQLFRVTTAGESHGPANVVIIDGVPPGLALSEEDLRPDLARRRPGQSKLTTARNEADEPEIIAGVFEGKTTGTSLAVLFRNQDARSKDYSDIKDKYRPGHADFSFDAKYGFRDYRGGGRSSARETVARVAAGAVAKKILAQELGVSILAYVKQVGPIVANVDVETELSLDRVEETPVRCPDRQAAQEMIELITQVKKQGDSIGGVCELVAQNVPAGLGEPVFDKLKADLAKAMLGLPAVLGFEYGAGFAVAQMRGSQNNDLFVPDANNPHGIGTSSNRHGGMLGGISTGQPIVCRVAIKPTSSLPKPQSTVTKAGQATEIITKGRHDPCLLPRFVPMGEAMMALVLVDHWLRWRAQRGAQGSSGR